MAHNSHSAILMSPAQDFNGWFTNMNYRARACRVFRLACFFFTIESLLFITIPSKGHAAGFDAGYLNALITDARERGISNEYYWDLLLHYRKIGKRRESTVNDQNFFLALNGKSDPQAELEETLRRLFQQGVEGQENVRCRFVARYAWLKDQLHIDETKLPLAACSEFDRTVSAINPQSVVLIFPAAYINSPASMFGHTLLRIDGGSESVLISLAVNYSAFTSEDRGISYAYKGITGGFQGYYSAAPYYEKVREYTAIEHRDILEYALNLTPDEVRRMFYHIWEMRGIGSSYYFLNRNCSFAILYLLEIARPSLHIIDHFQKTHHFWVIPGDTVRAIIDSGIVKMVTYRPSQATRIKNIARSLNEECRQAAYRVSIGSTASSVVEALALPEADQVRILDLAVENVLYMGASMIIGHDEYLSRFQELLKERNRHELSTQELYHTPSPVRPDQGHLPGRIGIGGGCRTGSCFEEVELRPLYHDLRDAAEGYVEGTTIDFIRAALRYDTSRHHLDLHSLRLVDIESLSPRDLFFHPLSWKFHIGAEQKILPDGRERLVTSFTAGLGTSKSIGSAITYALAETEVNAHRTFGHSAVLGTGGTVGLLIHPTSWWNINCSLKGITPLLGDPYRIFKGELVQNIMFGKNNGYMISVSREKINSYFRSEIAMLWNIYY